MSFICLRRTLLNKPEAEYMNEHTILLSLLGIILRILRLEANMLTIWLLHFFIIHGPAKSYSKIKIGDLGNILKSLFTKGQKRILTTP